MAMSSYRVTSLLAIIAAVGLSALTMPPAYVRGAPPAEKFEDLAKLHFGGNGVSATGIKDTGKEV